MSVTLEAVLDRVNEIEKTVRRLDDIEQIKKLQASYVYLTDTFQMEALMDLFTEDMVLDFTGAPQRIYVDNKATFRTMYDGAGKYYSMMQHITSTPLIDVDGDRATGTWYLLGPLTRKTDKGPLAIWEGGRYDNKYVRENGVWKISKLVFNFTLHCKYEDGWAVNPVSALDVDA